MEPRKGSLGLDFSGCFGIRRAASGLSDPEALIYSALRTILENHVPSSLPTRIQVPLAMNDLELAVGDLVTCDGDLFQVASRPDQRIGLVLEARRSTSRLFFPDLGHGLWLTRSRIRRVALEGGDPHRIAAYRLHHLIHLLEGNEADIEEPATETYVFTVFHERIDLPLLETIRTYLGESCLGLIIRPRSMSRIATEMTIRRGF